MSPLTHELILFSVKMLIVLLFIVFLFSTLMAIVSKNKDKTKGRLGIKNLNQKYGAMKTRLLETTLSKKAFKSHLKQVKKTMKEKEKTLGQNKKVFVIDFQGDIKASQVEQLREAITALLQIATPADEVVLRLESPGGLVHGYGLAAAQLIRLREKNIPLTITVDKVAASGGYLMACVGCKILSAPFAIIGSIGVLMQLPNLHRWLKKKDIDFVQLTAGEYKRTLTVFGENTKEGETKVKQELEAMHQLFKNLITTYRTQVDIKQIATGEYWLGQQALALRLVDAIRTSDDYLLEYSEHADIYEVSYLTKQSFLKRLSLAGTTWLTRALPHHIAV